MRLNTILTLTGWCFYSHNVQTFFFAFTPTLLLCKFCHNIAIIGPHHSLKRFVHLCFDQTVVCSPRHPENELLLKKMWTSKSLQKPGRNHAGKDAVRKGIII